MDVHSNVKKYYGETLTQSEDLKTNACCTAGAPPASIRKAISNIHDEVNSKYYGCGLVIPESLSGAKVLDLGCGAGRDCYILSQFVGENGHITGVDMTEKQLQVAEKHIAYHMDKFKFSRVNIDFKHGYLEKLDEMGLEKDYDIIVSNCVINLTQDKKKVFKNAFDLLKQGGEIYFSDVYSSQRIPKHLQDDPVLYGECLSGALYWNDFLAIAKEAGFSDPRLVEDSKITIANKELQEQVGDIEFYSATYRLFKIAELEPDCEDYGQAVRYKGKQPNFKLDNGHLFTHGKIETVCGNTFRMLNQSRFSEDFDFMGDFEKHFGLFEGCGHTIPFTSSGQPAAELSGTACC